MLPALKWQVKTNSQILIVFCSQWKNKEAPTLLVSKLPFLSLLLEFSRWLNISMSRSLSFSASQWLNRLMFQSRCLVLSTTQYLWMSILLGVSFSGSGLKHSLDVQLVGSSARGGPAPAQLPSKGRATLLWRFKDKEKDGVKIQKFLFRDHCDCSSIFHLW